MEFEEKVYLIDNQQNKEIVAKGIADDILTKYDLKDYSQQLSGWLLANIMKSTLADMLTNNQGIYIIDLAKKCMSDIAYMQEKHLLLDEDVKKMMPTIVDFCYTIREEYHLDNDEITEEIDETISNFDYEDTLILDDTMFIYKDNVGEERAFNSFRVQICVGYHPNYNQKGLKQRIAGRLFYHRDPNDLCVTFLEEEIKDNGDFHFVLRISDVLDKDEFEQALRFRLGSTSGKPWYRCHILNISRF